MHFYLPDDPGRRAGGCGTTWGALGAADLESVGRSRSCAPAQERSTPRLPRRRGPSLVHGMHERPTRRPRVAADVSLDHAARAVALDPPRNRSPTYRLATAFESACSASSWSSFFGLMLHRHSGGVAPRGFGRSRRSASGSRQARQRRRIAVEFSRYDPALRCQRSAWRPTVAPRPSPSRRLRRAVACAAARRADSLAVSPRARQPEDAVRRGAASRRTRTCRARGDGSP